jgi:anti-sigma B factor antagonist
VIRDHFKFAPAGGPAQPPHRERKQATLVRAAGELDLASVEALEEELRRNCDSSSLTLDLAALSFIDSSGICALVKATERCRESGQELRILNVSGQVRRVLELCRLDGMLLA